MVTRTDLCVGHHITFHGSNPDIIFSLLHHCAIIFYLKCSLISIAAFFYFNFKLFTVIVLLIMLPEILLIAMAHVLVFQYYIIHSDCARLILLPQMPSNINSAPQALCHNFMNIDELAGTQV